MRNDTSPSVIADFVAQAPADPAKLSRPLFASNIAAGFPSPAEDYVERMLDLNDYCIHNAPSTYYLRVRDDGYSMVDAGIYPGDLLCVDRSLTAQNGDIVVAMVDGEYTVKEFVRTADTLLLRPHNAEYADIQCKDFVELEIFGVVVAVIRKFRRGKHVRSY